MKRPKPVNVPGGPGMGPGSATENRAKRDPIVARIIMRSNQALARMTDRLRESDDRFNTLVERVEAASAAEDPHEAITHLLAEVQAEERAREKR